METTAGHIERYRERLVVGKRFFYKPTLDFGDIYTPVIEYGELQLILDFSGKHRLRLLQVYMMSSFLNGNPQEELYFVQLEYFVQDGQERKVMRLRKAPYGLR